MSNYRIIPRHDTKANWETNNPVLLKGEIGNVDDNPNLYKIGDGTSRWNDLPLRGYNGNISQVTGDNENAVMSQKATSAKFTEIEQEIIYDVSAHNDGAVFESLQELLSSSNLSTLIPTSVRHGGMSIRFIQGSAQSSGNKYVQYRLMSDTFNTTITNWQGIDDKPTVGSNNLVKSGGVGAVLFGDFYLELNKRFLETGYISNIENYACTTIVDGNGTYHFPSTSGYSVAYRIFKYVSDSEGVELTSGWVSGELSKTINDKFVVTFYGTNGNWNSLKKNYRIGGVSSGMFMYIESLDNRVTTLEGGANVDAIDISRTNDIVKSSILDGQSQVDVCGIYSPNTYTKNLLNTKAHGVLIGYRQIGPKPEENLSYNVTDYIPVTPFTKYVFSTKEATHFYMVYIVVFDKHLNFLRLYNFGGDTTHYTAQENDAFIKITIRKEAWGQEPQFEVGETATDYTLYGVDFEFPKIHLPKVSMPEQIYVLSGIENSIYHQNYQDFINPFIKVSSLRDYPSANWKYLSRCFRTTKGNEDIYILQTDIRTRKILKETKVKVVTGNPNTDNGNINVLCIGDSFTQDGRYVKMIKDCCPNSKMVGMRTPGMAQDVKCEGRGGWTLKEYSVPYGNVTPTSLQPFSPFVQASGYNYYGVVPFWAAIVNNNSQYPYGTNGFDKYKTWFGTDGKKLNPSVNDLMYDGSSFIYWNGSSWNTLSQAPSFSFDFTKYISIWQIDRPDFIFIFLGKNEFHNGITAWPTYKQTMDALVQSIHSYDSTIKIGICTPTTADEAPNNSDNRNAELAHLNMWDARKLMLEEYDSAINRSNNVFVVDTGTVLDPEYSFWLEERLPFAFYDGNDRELFATNSVHPNGGGYKQIGVCIAGFIQSMR